MTNRKPFKDLLFSDAFMFAAVMEDPEICRGVLERILGFPIQRVYVRSEAVLFVNPDYRGVRLDVLADDADGSIFNVEMQVTDQHNLPKRSRAYQSRMDLSLLKPGENFNRLPVSYVIFICTFDPFIQNYWRYTFDTRCRETGEELGDQAYKIFLNTKGTNTQAEPPELVHFLQYIENAAVSLQSQDRLIRQIERKLNDVKHDNAMEVQYMLFSEMLSQERMEGLQEGHKAGLQEGHKAGLQAGCQGTLNLIHAMSQNGDGDKVSLLAEDPALLKEMCLKYHMDLSD